MRNDRSLQGKRRVYARGRAKFKTQGRRAILWLKTENLTRKLYVVKREAGTNNRSVTDKEFVVDLLRRLPDDITIYDIAQQLEFVAAVRQGLAAFDENKDSISIEQVEPQLTSWSVTVGRKRKGRANRGASKTANTRQGGKNEEQVTR